MQTKRFLVSTVLLVTAGCGATAPKSTISDSQGVEAAMASFYSSLNTLFTGDSKPMLEIWSHADDVTYMGPSGGFQVGWEDVRTIWEAQAALKLGGKVEPSEARMTVSGDLAFVSCYEHGANHDAEGAPEQVSIRATNIFRKENGSWKMIGHHTDLLPFLEKQSPTSVNN